MARVDNQHLDAGHFVQNGLELLGGHALLQRPVGKQEDAFGVVDVGNKLAMGGNVQERNVFLRCVRKRPPHRGAQRVHAVGHAVLAVYLIAAHIARQHLLHRQQVVVGNGFRIRRAEKFVAGNQQRAAVPFRFRKGLRSVQADERQQRRQHAAGEAVKQLFHTVQYRAYSRKKPVANIPENSGAKRAGCRRPRPLRPAQFARPATNAHISSYLRSTSSSSAICACARTRLCSGSLTLKYRSPSI